MRTAMIVFIGLTSLAGCLGGDDANEGTPETQTPNAAVVFNGMGERVDQALYGGELPVFEQIHVSDRISGEPTIAVNRDGAVLYPAIEFDVDAVATSLPSTVYLISLDEGGNWSDVSPNVAGVGTHPTSFDPYVYADPTTGRLYALDMGPHVACNKVSWSDDNGQTWITREGACPLPVADHPNLFAGPTTIGGVPADGPIYPNTLFLCTNQLVDVQCSTSPDGGLNWLPSVPVFGAPDCGGLVGHGHASWITGTAFLGRAQCGPIEMARSTDGGATWSKQTIANGGNYTPSYGHDVMVASDKGGNVYAHWIGNGGKTAWLAVSHDDGQTWGEPIDVTVPGVTAAQLPGITAGEEGRIAIQYVGTDNPRGNQVGNGINDNETNYNTWLNATWNVHVVMSMNAHNETPIFAATTVNNVTEPVKRGACAGRCFGNIGGMYDFLDIDINPIDGRVWTAIVDVCTGDCDDDGANAETFQQAMGAVGKQIGGTFLLDEEIPERSSLVQQLNL